MHAEQIVQDTAGHSIVQQNKSMEKSHCPVGRCQVKFHQDQTTNKQKVIKMSEHAVRKKRPEGAVCVAYLGSCWDKFSDTC